MKYICTLITVSNLNKSREFYEKILNQKVKSDYGNNISFEGGFAIHQRDYYKKLIKDKEIRSECNNFELYFEYDDIQEIEKKLIAQNIEFVHKTQEQPWKQKVIRFYDLDKNIIEIGESMEFLAFRLFKEGNLIEDISQIISHPIDFVKAAIQKLDSKIYKGSVPACGCFCGGCPNYIRERKPCLGKEYNKGRCQSCKTFYRGVYLNTFYYICNNKTK